MLDAGTCASVDANSDCGDDAESHYETFEYTDDAGCSNGCRVIVISGAPDHDAEETLLIDESDGGYWNPNTRCKISLTVNICQLYHLNILFIY